MSKTNWEEQQKKAFLELFTNKKGISLELIHANLESITRVWQELYQILVKYGKTFDTNNSISMIKEIDYNDSKYLILKGISSEYIVIDMKLKKALTEQEVSSLFDVSVFANEFFEYNIDKTNMLYIEQVEQEGVINILDLYINYKEILLNNNTISYEVQNDDTTAKIKINMDTKRGMIILKNKEKETNYIFIDEKLIPNGMTSKNKEAESLFIMAYGIKDIIIPFQKIPSFLKIQTHSKKR